MNITDRHSHSSRSACKNTRNKQFRGTLAVAAMQFNKNTAVNNVSEPQMLKSHGLSTTTLCDTRMISDTNYWNSDGKCPLFIPPADMLRIYRQFHLVGQSSQPRIAYLNKIKPVLRCCTM